MRNADPSGRQQLHLYPNDADADADTAERKMCNDLWRTLGLAIQMHIYRICAEY